MSCALEKALRNIEQQDNDFCNITASLCDISDNEAMNNTDLDVPAFNFSFNPNANFFNPIANDVGGEFRLDNLFASCKPVQKQTSQCDMKLTVSSKVINLDDVIRPEPVNYDSDQWGGAFDRFTPYNRNVNVQTEIRPASQECT